MNVLVTGANGQLGNEVRNISRMSPHHYIYTDIMCEAESDVKYLDITDIEEVRAFVLNNDINVIVNCAGYTKVDLAEDEKCQCEQLNTKAPANLASVMKESGGLLIHISTDYVFGGDLYNTPCTENSNTAPTSVYGMTKLQGESAIQESGCDHVIIRSSWLYSKYGKNFVKTILNLISTRSELNVVFDQVGTPTYALDLAGAITVVLDDYAGHCLNTLKDNKSAVYPLSGIYHYSNEGVCSWYDFAKQIADYAGNVTCDIRPCHTDEFPTKVRRPSYSVLDKTKMKETFGLSIPYWTESLKKCIQTILSEE